jgi:hypothetical protein
VLEAALHQLARLQCSQGTGKVVMQSFNTILLIHTLRAIAEEIEKVNPNSPALAPLRYTINQKAAELSGTTESGHPIMPGAARVNPPLACSPFSPGHAHG